MQTRWFWVQRWSRVRPGSPSRQDTGEWICLKSAIGPGGKASKRETAVHAGLDSGQGTSLRDRALGPKRNATTLRVALLTNSLSPHSLPVCEQISGRVQEFRAFLSSDADRYHNFPRPDASFRVVVQRSLNQLRLPRRAYGSWQRSELHVPYDTLWQLRAYNPDLILSVQLGLRTALAAMYRIRRPEVKLILWATLSLHTEERRHWLRRVLRRWIVRRIDGAFVNGRQGEEYLRLLGYTGEVFTVPYAIDDTIFRSESYGPGEGVFRLIYAGQLVPQKGLLGFCGVLNRWCADHPDVSVHFELAGDGPEKRAIRALPLSRNLSLALFAAMDQQRLATHYHRADMLVFPTLGDEWGVVVNEAMIAGLPVLGSVYSQAVVELVDEGVSGWQFDPRDAESTYEALNRALGSSVQQLKTMSGQTKRKIAQLSPPAVALDAIRAMERISAQR